MKFKVVKNFQGEQSAHHACQIELVDPIKADEVVGWSTFDPRLFWQFIRGIKRDHAQMFLKNTVNPANFLSICLVRRKYFDTAEPTCMMVAHLGGDDYAIAPVVNPTYDPVFPDPVVPPLPEQKYEEWAKLDERYNALRDYHAYLTDVAEQYWAQAEERKNDTDSSSVKMMMELRHMHAVYTFMADEVLQYTNRLID